jgi:hypothetical protein
MQGPGHPDLLDFWAIFGQFFPPQKMAKNDKKIFRQNHPNGFFGGFECIFDTF